MSRARAVGIAVLLAVLAAAGCSRPASPSPSPSSPAPAYAPRPIPPAQTTAAPAKTPEVAAVPSVPPRQVDIRFHLFDGPAGFKSAHSRREFQPGARVVIGLLSTDIDVVLPGVPESEAQQAVTVKGRGLAGAPQWLPEGAVALRVGPGKAGEEIKIAVDLKGMAPAVLVLTRAAQATVLVDQQYNDEWRPVSILASSAPAGPAAVRLTFSKPVRREEVERALVLAQSGPVRGIMEWHDDQTLIWQIVQMPERVDFLLGGARDQDGLPLPGGIPSLRSGSAPILVEVELSNPVDLNRSPLPPDIISAVLTPERNYVNLKVWTPGTNRWDWNTADLHLDLKDKDKALRSGWQDPVSPRVPADISAWQVSPSGTLVAGLRPDVVSGSAPEDAHKAALTVMDLRGGRSQSFAGFINRYSPSERGGDLTSHITWSADSRKVAALHYRGKDPNMSDLIVLDTITGKREVLMENLPVPSYATRLSWAPDGSYLLAGNLLINLQAGSFIPLEGTAASSRGTWGPQGLQLLYQVKDWGAILLVEPAAGRITPLGTGLIVGWPGADRIYVVRWSGSPSRYVPPGL